MKPIVIYLKNDKDEITLTKKEFEKHLQDAYEQGRQDGYAVIPYYPSFPGVSWQTTCNGTGDNGHANTATTIAGVSSGITAVY